MSFFKIYISLFVLISSVFVKAQVKSINLPSGDGKIILNSTTPVYSIYIDKKNRFYLDKEPIDVYAIAKKISYARYKLEEWAKQRSEVHLYIDKRVDYSLVDLIKTELSSANFNKIIYRTISTKDIPSGTYKTNHQSFFKYQRLQKVLSDKQIKKNKKFNDSLRNVFGESKIIPPPPPPIANWFFENQHKIYSDNQEAIDEALENKTYKCVLLTNKGLKTDSEIIDLNNIDNLKELFSSVDAIFVKFAADLSYSNYFQTIVRYQEIDYSERAYFVELSSEINKIHKKSNITLCD